MGFGERLRRILEELNVSQNELGRRTGKDSSSINKIINSDINVTWKTIVEFAEALNISPARFFIDNDEEMIALMVQELPAELIEWLKNRENQLYLFLIKDAENDGLTLEKLTTLVEMYRKLEKNE